MAKKIEATVQRQLGKLAFAVAILAYILTVPMARPVNAWTDNTCTCTDWVAAYYYTDPVYGPWIFRDQVDVGYGETNYGVGAPGPYLCEQYCSIRGENVAHFLCDYWDYPGEHYQYAGWWTWTDTNNDSGGSAEGWVNTEPDILYCP